MNTKCEEFASYFCPFGYRDIEVAIENAEAAGKTVEEAAGMVQGYAEETGMPLEKIDPVACIFDTLHQEARTEIEQATGKDISNDAPYHGVNIAGNYMCTSFDGKDDDIKALRELLETMKERSSVVEWLLNKLN